MHSFFFFLLLLIPSKGQRRFGRSSQEHILDRTQRQTHIQETLRVTNQPNVKTHPPKLGQNSSNTGKKLWAGDTVVHLSHSNFWSAFSLQAPEINTGLMKSAGLAAMWMGVRGGCHIHLRMCLLSVDSPLRQQSQEWLSSFNSSSVPLLLFSHLLSAPVWHCSQPISVCLHDSHLLIECLSQCQLLLSSDPNGSQIALTSALWTGCHLSVSRSLSQCFSSESPWRRNPPLNRHYPQTFLHFFSQKAANSSSLYLFLSNIPSQIMFKSLILCSCFVLALHFAPTFCF